MLRPVTNVFLFVDDLEAAAAWYRARLGRDPVRVASQMVTFAIGADGDDAVLVVHRADGYNAVGPAGSVAYWGVDDVDTVVADWTANGATAHRGPKTIATGERLCQLLDPFGNLVGIRQAAAPAPGKAAGER
jgi:predicted enzyme related to lactoylglutathione lyase